MLLSEDALVLICVLIGGLLKCGSIHSCEGFLVIFLMLLFTFLFIVLVIWVVVF